MPIKKQAIIAKTITGSVNFIISLNYIIGVISSIPVFSLEVFSKIFGRKCLLPIITIYATISQVYL